MNNVFNRDMLRAISVMIGYIIGVGMFGLPFVVAQGGIVPFLVFIIFFGGVQYFQHMIYANMVLVTSAYHRLPGYAGVYLGTTGKNIVFAAKMVGNCGALLAYIIIIGIFLNQLLSPVFGGSEFLYSTIVFLFAAGVVYFGINTIARVETIMSGLLILVVLFIIIKGRVAIDISNYHILDWKYMLIPYGATLMALDGNGSIPIVVKLLKKNPSRVKQAVRIGTLLPIIITVFFTLTIVGISGATTTPDALVGIKQILNNGVILFSLIFGVLSMTTSILLVTEAVRETLWWDYKVNKNLAWALAVFTPYSLFLFGIRNLTEVISFAGGVAGGLSAIMLLLIFRNMKAKKHNLRIFKWQTPNYIIYFFIFLFVLGMCYEIYYFLIN
ncbi:hypothetical protein KAR28_06325 [Candidatus Parcubacteria bacterium]|nr:hypothetical protein [Candidatus Parcubacteria bacterium]